MSKKLHTVFSKTDYKFQKMIEQLEKEWRQRCNRLQEIREALFEMSLKPPNMKESRVIGTSIMTMTVMIIIMLVLLR